MFLDEKGRDELIENLKSLKFPNDKTSNEHFHLFTDEWGGNGLVGLNAATCKRLGLKPIHHLKVYMRPSHKDV